MFFVLERGSLPSSLWICTNFCAKNRWTGTGTMKSGRKQNLQLILKREWTKTVIKNKTLASLTIVEYMTFKFSFTDFFTVWSPALSVIFWQCFAWQMPWVNLLNMACMPFLLLLNARKCRTCYQTQFGPITEWFFMIFKSGILDLC